MGCGHAVQERQYSNRFIILISFGESLHNSEMLNRFMLYVRSEQAEKLRLHGMIIGMSPSLTGMMNRTLFTYSMSNLGPL